MRRLDCTPTVTGTFSMGSSRKVMTIKWPHDIGINVIIMCDEFDRLVDENYDDIVIVTPARRYVSSLDDWLDYGYIDIDGDVDVRVLGRAYFGRA
jgi:hypothetical protein